MFNRVLASRISRVLVCFTIMVSSITAAAPPKAISYDDALVVRQNSLITNDWSETQAFDLKNPIEIQVVVVGVEVQAHQYTTLTFRLVEPMKPQRDISVNSDATYRAILQSSDEFNRLRVPLMRLAQGSRVTLIAWPATERNYTSIAMLVDTIVFSDDGARLHFHEENQALRDRAEGKFR